MSYILDALRKSEVDKARGDGPSLLNHVPAKAHPLNRWLLLAVVALLVVNVAVLGAWLIGLGLSTAQEPAQTAAPATPTLPSPIPPSTAPDEPVAEQIAAAPAAEPRETLIAPPSRADVSEVARVIGPDYLRAPAMEISTHVYSDDPALRSVTIDGRRLREGDEVRSGVRLIEITEAGIVVDAGGARTEMDVLQDWR